MSVVRTGRGEKLHRRITPGKTLGVATVSEPDKNISFNAWKRVVHGRHVGNFGFSIRLDPRRRGFRNLKGRKGRGKEANVEPREERIFRDSSLNFSRFTFLSINV